MLGETLCRPPWLQLPPASIEAAGKVLVSAGRVQLRKEIGFPIDLNSSGLENCIFQGQLGGHHFYPLTVVPWLRAWAPGSDIPELECCSYHSVIVLEPVA